MKFLRRSLLLGAAPALLLGGAAHADTATYQYDALGRLVRVTFTNGSFVAYSYDTAGNRSEVIRSDNTTYSATLQVTGSGAANLRSIADAAGYGGAQHVSVTFQVGAAITLKGASQAPMAGAAIDTGTWPSHLFSIALTLQINGKVYGGGGVGGSGGEAFTAGSGFAGGDAIYCRESLAVVVNPGGEVKAGGGGGGGGACWVNTITDGEGQEQTYYYPAGGGGGGFPNGTPGGSNASGSTGTNAGGGAGGVGGQCATSGPLRFRINASGGAGGNASTAGATGAGNPSGTGGVGTWIAGNPGSGGQPGYAVRKNGKTVTVTNNGVIVGAQG